jgi:hypothetical protein
LNSQPIFNPYNVAFYEEQRTRSYESATLVVPFIMEMIHPTSVVDVGCGVGTWLRSFIENGVTDVMGFDGGNPSNEQLYIPLDCYKQTDFSSVENLHRKADMVMSLEVAEHLPAEAVDHFVDLMAKVSDVVLFGAAVPGQGGTHHVNEHWQSFWIKKWAEREYFCYDIVRPKFWNIKQVCWWYSQNTFLFIKKGQIDKYPKMKELGSNNLIVDIVHPQRFSQGRYFS